MTKIDSDMTLVYPNDQNWSKSYSRSSNKKGFKNESGSSDFEKEKVLCPVCQVVGFPLHRCPHIVVHMNFHSALFVYQNSQGNGILHHLLKVVFSLKEPKVLLREEGEQSSHLLSKIWTTKGKSRFSLQWTTTKHGWKIDHF